MDSAKAYGTEMETIRLFLDFQKKCNEKQMIYVTI